MWTNDGGRRHASVAGLGLPSSDAESVAIGHGSVPGFRDIGSVLRFAPVLRYFTSRHFTAPTR